MKRGKSTSTPTKAEQRWMAAITEFGCVVCHNQQRGYVPAEVHHMLAGGIRMGHLFTIPLCHGHHRAGGSGEVSRHPDRVEFEHRYGREIELLEQMQGLIAKRRAAA